MTDSTAPQGANTVAASHRLELQEVELIGASRAIAFRPGLNIVQGAITTGKTTLVRLIRAMLGTMPSGLAPEVDYITALRGKIATGARLWQVYRPRTTTRDALIEVSEQVVDGVREPLSLRLPVAGSDRSYSVFLLDQLGIPAVSVPRARSDPAGALTPVTISDWLGYCIITGDELDTQVFGHHNDWRNAKRRWVFELVYGYFDAELARLNAQLRSIELQLNSIDQAASAAEDFLAGTPFADIGILERGLTDREAELEGVLARRRQLAQDAADIPGIGNVREELLVARSERAEVAVQISRIDGQIKDLHDLQRQLSSQSARLTRAIVADEWLVDFDFIVCPRCGSDVDAGRVDANSCYLCLQTPRPAPSRAQLLSEQDRISSQMSETNDVIRSREAARVELGREISRLEARTIRLAAELDERTQTFVSDRSSRLEFLASQQARIESDVQRLREYREILRRHQDQLRTREDLELARSAVESQIHEREVSRIEAEGNVEALERRLYEYLRDLRIPDLGQALSVNINRTTYMPEISGRSFDELSSQGLKTLVNIAHALAHHTVAIDRSLPLPGLLIMDGLSANAGHEGFDQERVRDVYSLLRRVAAEYEDALQIVAVDNDLDRTLLLQHSDRVILTLKQSDRLIRIPPTTSAGDDA